MQEIRDEHGRPIQLTDELGRPVQLTDEHGVPVNLTGVATTQGHTHTTLGSEIHDKTTPRVATTDHGHATIGSELRHKMTHDQTTDTTMGSETHGGNHFAPTPIDYLKRGGGAGAATVGAAAGAAKGAVTGGGAPVSHTQAHSAAGGDDKEMEHDRSTSSSSTSSEDDGEGGRRKKKGLMQKIKEKLPGRHKKEEKQATAHSADTKVSSAVGGPAGIRVEHHEQEHKKGPIDKIKEKLPGTH